jgi:hypothetical protein
LEASSSTVVCMASPWRDDGAFASSTTNDVGHALRDGLPAQELEFKL